MIFGIPIGLDWIRQETTSNDVAMVFFAGHGVNDQNNYFYFCPYNVDPSRLLRTGVADSCHYGSHLQCVERPDTLIEEEHIDIEGIRLHLGNLILDHFSEVTDVC